MTYEALEDALLTALEPLKTEGLKTLKSYGGEFSPDSFGQCPIAYPALMVCIPELTNETQGNLDRQALEVVVYVADRNLRGEGAARHGAYRGMEQARARLHRLPVAGAGRLALQRESLVGYSAQLGLCVMQATYRLKMQHTIPFHEGA